MCCVSVPVDISSGPPDVNSICFLQTCEQAGEGLVACEGQCCGMFHLSCLGLSFKPDDKLLCQQCSTGEETSETGVSLCL